MMNLLCVQSNLLQFEINLLRLMSVAYFQGVSDMSIFLHQYIDDGKIRRIILLGCSLFNFMCAK